MTTKKTKKTTTPADRVAKLKTEIAKLTDAVPDSTDHRYLAQRLADLKRRKAAGEDVKHREASGSVVISASMPLPAGEAFDSILTSEQCKASSLVRKALAFWAAKHGYAREATVIGADA